MKWTKEEEVALNVFANFMANILEKYGAILDEQVCDNDKKGINIGESKCENACSFMLFFVLTMKRKCGNIKVVG